MATLTKKPISKKPISKIIPKKRIIGQVKGIKESADCWEDDFKN